MTNKQKMLKRQINVIRGQALIVREDKTLTQEEKIEQLQVLADLMEVVLEKLYEEEKRIDINKLKEELEEQTRNGRTQVYIKVEDLKTLTDKKEIKEEGRVYLDIDYVKELIDTYEYRNSFKQRMAVKENDEELER